MIKSITKINDNVLIIIIGAILFVPFLGLVHLFDWDEINFAESAREMLLTSDYFRVQVNFQPFWEKPPLFIWLQVLSMKIFGINEFAARLPNACTGILTLLVIYHIGKKHFGKPFGWIWVMTYIGSFLTYLYFKSGIIDPLFNLFIFLGIYFLSLAYLQKDRNSNSNLNIILAGIFIGLGVLTKGPVALLVALLSILVFYISNRTLWIFSIKEWLLFLFFVGFIAFAWFGVETIKNGPWFLQEFITYQIRLFKTQDAGHGGPFIYHFIVLYIGCFPASVFIFHSFKQSNSDTRDQRVIKLWFIISFFVVLLLFSIVKTKIVHYSSFCYLPLTFLAAYTLNKIYSKQIKIDKYIKVQSLIVGGLISLLLIAVPLILIFKNQLITSYGHLIKDPFALANLEAQVNWSGWEVLIGFLYLMTCIYFFISNNDSFRKIILLFLFTSIVITATLNIVVPKIERYSQGAAIDFFKSLTGKDVYVDVYGYKSYAHLFYTKKQPHQNKLSIDKEWLLHGNIDKDVYMVTKIDNTDLDNMLQFERIGSKNGFVFYRRKALNH